MCLRIFFAYILLLFLFISKISFAHGMDGFILIKTNLMLNVTELVKSILSKLK